MRELILLRKFDALEKFVITPKIYDIILPENVVMVKKVEHSISTKDDKSQDSKVSKTGEKSEV